MSYCVVMTNARAEILAAKAIEALGVEVYLPLFVKRVRHGRRMELERRALLPGYLFAEITDRWPEIFSRRGVKTVLCDIGQRWPKSVRETEMARIREIAADYDGVICDDAPLEEGQVIRIIEGAFSGSSGTVNRVEADGFNVRIMVDAFGGRVALTLPRDCVAPAA